MQGQQDQATEFAMGKETLMLKSEHKAILARVQERYDEKMERVLTDRRVAVFFGGMATAYISSPLLFVILLYALPLL